MKKLKMQFDMNDLVAIRHAINKYIDEYCTDEDANMYALKKRFQDGIKKLEGAKNEPNNKHA